MFQKKRGGVWAVPSFAFGAEAFSAPWSYFLIDLILSAEFPNSASRNWDSASRIWIFYRQNVLPSPILNLYLYTPALLGVVTQFCKQSMDILLAEYCAIIVIYLHIYKSACTFRVATQFCRQNLDILPAKYSHSAGTIIFWQNLDILPAELE